MMRKLILVSGPAWDLTPEQEFEMVEKFRLAEKKPAADDAWDDLCAWFFPAIRTYFFYKTFDDWLAEELAEFTLARARNNIKKGKYEQTKARLCNYLVGSVAAGVWKGYTIEGIAYIRKDRPAADNRNANGDDHRDPIEDLAAENIDYIEAENELHELTFRVGGTPHQLIVFGFIQLLAWEKDAFLKKLSGRLLGGLGEKFCCDYYESFWQSMKKEVFRAQYCDGLLSRLRCTVNEIYKRTIKRLEKYSGLRVGAVPMKIFFKTTRPPGDSIDDWCNKIRTRVEKAYRLKRATSENGVVMPPEEMKNEPH